MLPGEFRPYFMSACNPHGEAFQFAESGPNSTIRFASVFECPVVSYAMGPHVKRAPQGGRYQSDNRAAASVDWTFYSTKEYKTLRFAMQSFPSKWFVILFIIGIL